ncbi:Endonuclease IV [Candidatus Syntrophocurvum alkaliphilum]|uniref:Probable endonuclease 4 n=1 Tax=Candidatus Syntrophocurvum alkaliphilum TaxID=2293317 RepID=A0A6I6DCI7_9FIRM|nr:deoxyribonuclease IV [Candidatus Syntrophocurvum alkaliphilum]QGT99949.1 Endonuclease IV [Candidatus Syntrophocurvum alkaliphilum]
MKKINNPRIGAHLPISKGLKSTSDEAVKKGLESLQIFLRNPRGRGARNLTDDEINYFKRITKDYNISPIVVHIPYICNPASVKNDIYSFAYEVVLEDLKRCSLVGADYLVLHPGSHTTSTLDQGIERVIDLLNRVIDQHNGKTQILLELMSGQGTEVGKNFAELNQIINGITKSEKVGVCYDTCHAFAAGYECRTTDDIDELLNIINITVGTEKIKVVHANDSAKELGSHRDRHTMIGEGFIGIQGFKALMHNKFFKNLPFILETPIDTIDTDINTLKSIKNK